MTTITEIEAAIEKLPPPLIEELAGWLEKLHTRQVAPAAVDNWLQRARGAANPGVTTASVMDLTRGEE